MPKKRTSLVRRALRRALPGVYERLFWQGPAIAGWYLRHRFGDVVLSGPFTGMRYVRESAGSAFAPKLLGTYESELHPAIMSIASERYDQVVDVGCAEGYYAVGLALMFRVGAVAAYDSDPKARALCEELAAVNGVSDRVTVLGACDPSSLRSARGRRSLVICDCEGYEADLFTADAVEALGMSDLIVELHGMFRPGVEEYLANSFVATHEVALIPVSAREPEAPLPVWLPSPLRKFAVDEFRHPSQKWMFLRARRREERA